MTQSEWQIKLNLNPEKSAIEVELKTSAWTQTLESTLQEGVSQLSKLIWRSETSSDLQFLQEFDCTFVDGDLKVSGDVLAHAEMPAGYKNKTTL